jgi:hypothetical protein
MIRRSLLVTCATAVAGFWAAPASAELVYYWQGGGGGTDQSYSYVVADTFEVNSSNVSVDKLSVFDSAYATGGSISTDIYVALYNDTTNSLVISPIDFNGVTDPSKSPYVSITLSHSVQLVAGDTYSIEAWGFNSTNMLDELYVNTNGNSDVGFNSLGGALTDDGSGNCNLDSTTAFNAVTGSGCSNPGANFHNHGNDFFGAGSFEVPEPPSWALMLGGFAGLGFFGYRRRRQLAAR